MTEIRYGLVEGPGKGKELPTAASQSFARRGGKFCYLVAGNVTLCATGSNRVSGWAETPKDAAGLNYWTSSSVAETDKVFVINGDPSNLFEVPVDEANASLAASWVGKGVGLVVTATTQKAKLGSATASPLSIVDVDTDNKTVRVRVKTTCYQAV